MQPELQKLQGGMPNAPRGISLQGQLCYGQIGSGASFLTGLAMPEAGWSTAACKKMGVGCKCLGGFEWTMDPDS
jgi:hypothetical protein